MTAIHMRTPDSAPGTPVFPPPEPGFLHIHRNYPVVLHNTLHLVIFLRFYIPHLVFRQHLQGKCCIMQMVGGIAAAIPQRLHHPLPPCIPPEAAAPAPQASQAQTIHG